MRTLLLLSLWFAHFNVICQATERRKREAARLDTPGQGVLPAVGDNSIMAETRSAGRHKKLSKGFQPLYVKRKYPLNARMVRSVLYTRGKILSDDTQQDIPISLDLYKRHKRSLAEAGQFRQQFNEDNEELGLQYADDTPSFFMKRPRRTVIEEESRIPVLRGELLQDRIGGEDEPQPRLRLARGQQLKDELYHHAKQNGLIVLGPDPGAIQQVRFDRVYEPSPQRGRRYNRVNYQENSESFPQILQNSNDNVYNIESRQQRNSLDYDFPSYDDSVKRNKLEQNQQTAFLDYNFRPYNDPVASYEKESQLPENSLLGYNFPSNDDYGPSVQQLSQSQLNQPEQLINYDSPSSDTRQQRFKLSKQQNDYPLISDYQDLSYDNRGYPAGSQPRQRSLSYKKMPLYGIESNVADYDDGDYDRSNDKDNESVNRELLENLQLQLQNMQQVLSSYDSRLRHRRKRKRKFQRLGRGRANF